MQLFHLYLVSFIGLASALPSFEKRADQTIIKVVNNCGKTLQVGHLNPADTSGTPDSVATGGSKTYSFSKNLASLRFWARVDCQGGSDCQTAGAAFPASLAEFTFNGANGKDFYDLSFVDGYNLPLSVTPTNPAPSNGEGGKYWCGTPACKNLPACPSGFTKSLNGKNSGCVSACSKFNTEEYCCTGSHNTSATCPINSYAAKIKQACPDVYSYAYDDKASLYQCKSSSYTITWCPK
ncbi:thaumatin [Gilbertella persicaria]|uniref:thaumatin n=1 Tax=Gilbertella persicaria TaxID=101096 RepID=UPI00222066DB|nr:thaumatin [Gilbertella persicaria]KAI8086846.1 thaumatin [Gilbertella persicaria]